MALHKDVDELNQHEPKGMSTAAITSVYRAVGGGTGAWEQTILVVPSTLIGNANRAIIVNDAEDGIEYSNFSPTLVLSGESFIDQNPTGLDAELQIEYGAQQITTDATLDADGLVTLHTTGDYEIGITTQVGRSGSAGTAFLFSRILFQGAQQGSPAYHTMDSNTDTIATSFTLLFYNPIPGLTFAAEIIRDSGGTDDGGLLTQASAGWGPAPSATIRISKYEAV